MKKSTKNILIGAGIATAVGAIAATVIYQLRLIKKLTTDIDEMTVDEEPVAEIEAAEEAVEEAVEEA